MKKSRASQSFTSFTFAWTICQKSPRDIIKKSHRNHATKDQNAIAEKKEECPMKGNCQVNNIVYKCDVKWPLPSVSWASRERMREAFL